jgi:hypothetical protein
MTTFKGQTYLDLDAGERARDAGLASVGGSDWIERAAAVVVRELAGQEVLAESFRVVCERHGIGPEHHNGWGALTMALAKQGTITETGRMAKSQSPRSHARRQPVWRVM